MEVSYYLLIAFLLTKVPVLGTYIRLVNTIVHELFHVMVAKLTGGKGYRITLHADTSGQALIGSTSWISGVLISYAGYTGSSVMALVLFYLLHENYYATVVFLFLIIAVVSTVLWIRNLFGLLWSVSFIVILYFFVNGQLEAASIHIGYLLASVILVESITSTLQIMILSFRHPLQAGDATSLQQATKVPALVWGIVFFTQSIYFGYVIVTDYVLQI